MRMSLNLEMTRSTVIAGVLMSAAAAAYMFFFFIPRMRSVSDTLAELGVKQSYILESQKSHKVSEQSQRDLVNAHAYSERHAQQIMTQQQLPAFFSRISQIAKDNGTTTTRFEPQPAVQYDSCRKLSVILGLNGSFDALYGLVRDFEAMPARVWIDDIKFRGPREAGKPVECDITLAVFVDNPEKTD